MRIVVLGCGNIGSVVTRDLTEGLPSAQIVIADLSKSRAEEAVSRIGHGNASWIQVDASNQRELISTLKKFDLAVGTLPGSMGFQACKAAVSAGIDIVDVSYMPEDVMALDKAALKANVCIVPDCGMSPGLGNILVGHAISRLDSVETVFMLNGGLPEKPVPPLGYVITWSVKDLIDMYSRKVTVVKGGKVAKVEAMSGLEEITFPKVGKLEAFYTDGLRTLLHTVKGVREMWEKTLRYQGHVQKIKLLKALGFFEEKPIEIGNFSVSPRELTVKLFEKKLKKPEVRDIVAMMVKVGGVKNGRAATYTYHLFDHYDKKRKVTAMARTTAYTASVVAQLMAKRVVEDRGVVPPEKLGMNEKFYSKFMDQMKKRHIAVKESG
jgi:saccharopine dehydrogenase-like NADP-dependent oxidoreductase